RHGRFFDPYVMIVIVHGDAHIMTPDILLALKFKMRAKVLLSSGLASKDSRPSPDYFWSCFFSSS
ncbi:MAG: hypothetical protein ACP5VS_08450, partial [Desulfomonilaceae bacterium]